MWYALCRPQIDQREKEKLLAFCKGKVGSGCLTDAFIFTCERMRRYEGAWHLERVPLFPDYVFLEGGSPEAMGRILDQNPFLSQSGERQKKLLPVPRGTQRLLQELCGPARHMPMSRGVIARGQTHVTEGPLKGREQMIRRIDRHKRLALLDRPILPGQQMKVGLEITAKTVGETEETEDWPGLFHVSEDNQECEVSVVTPRRQRVSGHREALISG